MTEHSALIAILGTGLSFARELANAHTALITRGLAGMRELCVILDGSETSLMGMVGLSDLVLTC